MHIHGVEVFGKGVDSRTGCAHYRSPLDLIAVKFKCCENWFSCFECHSEIADHPHEVWSADSFDTRAILCGACGYRLTIREYFDCGSVCPKCSASFNPGCRKHYDLYFEI